MYHKFCWIQKIRTLCRISSQILSHCPLQSAVPENYPKMLFLQFDGFEFVISSLLQYLILVDPVHHSISLVELHSFQTHPAIAHPTQLWEASIQDYTEASTIVRHYNPILHYLFRFLFSLVDAWQKMLLNPDLDPISVF